MTAEQASQTFMRVAERSTTLYALSDEYIHLVELLEDPETVPEEVDAELARLTGEIAGKAENIVGLIKWCDGLAAMRKVEAQRMAASVGALERKSDWLRAYVLKHMQAMDVPRIDTGRFTLKRVLNPPRVEVLEAMAIPHEFNRTKIITEPDKAAIARHYKETGEIVAGVDIVRAERLDIS